MYQKIILMELAERFRTWKSKNAPESTDDTKDIKPWSSTSPSWTKSLKRFFNIHERTGVSKTTCGMKRVPLLSLKNVRPDKIHFFSWKFNFWLLISFCQNIHFTLKRWICKVLTRKARIFIGKTSVWRIFGANLRSWSINLVVCEILGYFFWAWF